MKEGEYIRILEKNKTEMDFFQSSKYVYRFLPLERLLETLHTKQLTFVSPTMWNDPYDNFLFKQVQINKNSFTKKFFVLCMTNDSHSHAYWNTYSPAGMGVRLKLRRQALLDLVSSRSEKAWLGMLKYEYEKDIRNHLKNTTGLANSLNEESPNKIFLDFFHKKRMPFAYEKESRISILGRNQGKDGLYRIKFEPKELISELYLDPHMGINEVKGWKEYLKQYDIPVKRSLLLKEQIHKIQ